jgi:transaldolase
VSVFSSQTLHEPVDLTEERAIGLRDLRVKLFADGADKKGILELNSDPLISGITTNPTLMRKAGISHYEGFAREILEVVQDKPVSLEVFSDEAADMKRQALIIASWGRNVYVKIPVTNTRGESTASLVEELAREGVKLNVTAILTLQQVREVTTALSASVPAVVSVFAGRIADAGLDPEPIIRASHQIVSEKPSIELLWASVREVFNIFQANRSRCHIVTVPHDILAKAQTMVGYDLGALSLETVKMFARDAAGAAFVV